MGICIYYIILYINLYQYVYPYFDISKFVNNEFLYNHNNREKHIKCIQNLQIKNIKCVYFANKFTVVKYSIHL